MDPLDDIRKRAVGLNRVLGRPPLVPADRYASDTTRCARHTVGEPVRSASARACSAAATAPAASARLSPAPARTSDPSTTPSLHPHARHAATIGENELPGEVRLHHRESKARDADVCVVPGDPGPRRPDADRVEDGRGSIGEGDRSVALAEPLRGHAPVPRHLTRWGPASDRSAASAPSSSSPSASANAPSSISVVGVAVRRPRGSAGTRSGLAQSMPGRRRYRNRYQARRRRAPAPGGRRRSRTSVDLSRPSQFERVEELEIAR